MTPLAAIRVGDPVEPVVYSWVVVDHELSSLLHEVAMESKDQTTGQSVSSTPANQIEIASTAILTGANAWRTLGVVLGAPSKILFKDFRTALATGNAGSGANSGQGSITLGSSDAAWGIGNYWDGPLAEVMASTDLIVRRRRGCSANTSTNVTAC